MKLTTKPLTKKEVLFVNIMTQEAKKKQAVVERAIRKGKSEASRRYGVSLSSVKRWCKRHDRTWQSLINKSRRPHSHPKRHTVREGKQIKNSFKKHFQRYGWDGVYSDIKKQCEAMYGELGISLTSAINVFLLQSLRVGGFPFDVRMEQPNKETMAAMLEAEHIARDPSVKRYSDVEEALRALKE